MLLQQALLQWSKVINDAYKCSCHTSTNHILLHLQIFTSPCLLFIFTALLSNIHRIQSSQSFPSCKFQKDEMKRERGMLASLFMWASVAGFLFQNLVIPVMSIRFEDQKHYYSPPDPHSGSPPTGLSHICLFCFLIFKILLLSKLNYGRLHFSLFARKYYCVKTTRYVQWGTF